MIQCSSIDWNHEKEIEKGKQTHLTTDVDRTVNVSYIHTTLPRSPEVTAKIPSVDDAEDMGRHSSQNASSL